MASKLFADANILLDFTLQRAGYQTAKELIQLAIEGKLLLYTSPSVVHITAYWLTKAYNPQTAKQLLLSLLADVQVIDCDHATSLMALNSKMDDIEDALQYYTALHHGMDYFISADKKLKKVSIPQLPVYTAAELIAEIGR